MNENFKIKISVVLLLCAQAVSYTYNITYCYYVDLRQLATAATAVVNIGADYTQQYLQ